MLTINLKIAANSQRTGKNNDSPSPFRVCLKIEWLGSVIPANAGIQNKHKELNFDYMRYLLLAQLPRALAHGKRESKMGL